MAGLLSAARCSGQINFDGQSLLDLDRQALDKVRGTQIGTIFQDPGAALNPLHTIGSQIGEGLRVHQERSAKEAKDLVLEAMNNVGFHQPERVYDLYPYELSGGMKQRTMICMATINRPKLLIADEPTTALDTLVQAQIIDLITNLQAQLGLSVIFITHNLSLVAQVADEVIVMYAGQIVETGTVADVLQAPAHPYTRLLIACSPDLAKQGERLFSIPGSMPDILQDYRLGCRIANRIPSLAQKNHDGHAALTKLSESHWVRCNCHKDFDIEEVIHADLG